MAQALLLRLVEQCCVPLAPIAASLVPCTRLQARLFDLALMPDFWQSHSELFRTPLYLGSPSRTVLHCDFNAQRAVQHRLGH